MAESELPPAGAVIAPCKITQAAGEINTFRVKAADLPVSVTIESDPASCQFKIAQIDIYSGEAKVDSRPGINDVTAKLPPTAGKKLCAGIYDVFIAPTPASGAPVGDPFHGGTALVFESCDAKTLLLIADASFPLPHFNLEVV